MLIMSFKELLNGQSTSCIKYALQINEAGKRLRKSPGTEKKGAPAPADGASKGTLRTCCTASPKFHVLHCLGIKIHIASARQVTEAVQQLAAALVITYESWQITIHAVLALTGLVGSCKRLGHLIMVCLLLYLVLLPRQCASPS